MAVTFESLSLKGIRLAHLRQLKFYIESARGAGYYGNKEQFDARHEQIYKWISEAETYASQPDVKMPK